MLCFCESVKSASGCLQTNSMASLRPFGLPSICRTVPGARWKAGGPEDLARTVRKEGLSKQVTVDRKAVCIEADSESKL